MSPHRFPAIRSLAVCAIVAVLVSSVSAAGPEAKKLEQARAAGVKFLKSTQSDDGSWTAPSALGIGGLATYALLESGVPADDPAVKKGLAYLLAHAHKDGGIYGEGSKHQNYETCIALLALNRGNADGEYTSAIAAAEAFLRKLQWDEGEGLESADLFYGGAGYGGHARPDLSNTQFLVETLKALGAQKDDPAIQKALTFVSRTQNLESEHNTTPFAAKINDGGFYYTPAAGGTSQAGPTPDGGLRSYGSMTYAGLKSMIYAGLGPDDPRVKAATEWLRKHYSVTENPGMGQAGLFYYYHTFAKTLSVLGEETFEDAQGVEHDWRAELVDQVTAQQKENGSWVNEADRWMEGNPALGTAYNLLTLAYCAEK